jgi:hypothetical protein
MPIIQRPGALGIMLCDQVLFEQGTQKPTLVGVFTGIGVTEFPSAPQRFDFFAALTDGLGQGDIDLVVDRLDPEERIAHHSLELSFPDPLHVINLRFRFRELSFPAAGSYVFALQVDGDEIAQRRVQVHQVEDLP